MKESIEYLGQIVMTGQLNFANQVVAAVQEVQPPRNNTQPRSLFSKCNVYRRFVTKFSSIEAPLNRLLINTETDILGHNDNKQRIYQNLKDNLETPTVLKLP